MPRVGSRSGSGGNVLLDLIRIAQVRRNGDEERRLRACVGLGQLRESGATVAFRRKSAMVIRSVPCLGSAVDRNTKKSAALLGSSKSAATPLRKSSAG